MAKLHELLAVESGLQTTAKNIIQETIRTFEKKDEHFVETVRAVNHFADEDAKLNTTEVSPMITTVFDKLLYTTGSNIRALDAFFQKEATNQQAKADLVVGDKTLLTDMPAAALLGLETKLTELRAMYMVIPTLAPGHSWIEDRTTRAAGGVYKTLTSDTTFRTKKTVKPIVMAPATEHHQAQVQAIQEDVPVARIETSRRSGMITSAQKSQLLDNFDRLIRAVKRARQRANATEVDNRRIGKVLIDFIHADIVA